MIIYYDNTTTERYREIISLGGAGLFREGQIAVDITYFPPECERKTEVYWDTINSIVIPRDDIIIEKIKKEAREYVIAIAKGVFSFIPEEDKLTAITYVKNKLLQIKNATTISAVTTIVGQVETQVNNILENL